jgi:hypothetical protein
MAYFVPFTDQRMTAPSSAFHGRIMTFLSHPDYGSLSHTLGSTA